MAGFSIADFFASVSFRADDASRSRAEGSYAKFEKAVRDAEARILKAKADGAKAAVRYALEIEAAQAREALEAAKAAAKIVAAEEAKTKAQAHHAKQSSDHSAAFVRGMTAMALAAGTAGIAITAALVKVSHAFETLYFTSQRTGASVSNIKSLQYAFTQVGSTGTSAVGAIESFARAMRTNPGIGGFVRSLGVATQEGGKVRDTLDVLSDAVDKISAKHPYYTGAQMAELLGLDESQFETFNRYRKEIKEYRAEYEASLKAVGLNSAKAAEQSEHFQQALRRIGMQVTVAGQSLLVSLLPVLERLAGTVSRFMTENAPALNGFFTKVGEIAQSAATGLEGFIKGFSGEEGARRIQAWADAMNNLADGMRGVWRVIAWIQDSMFWKALTYFESPLWKFLKYAGGSAVGSAQASTGASGGVAPSAVPPDDRTLWQKIAPKALGGKDAPAAGDGSRSWRNNNPGNLKYGDFAKRMGATGADDKGFARFPDYSTGRAAQENLLFNDDRYKNLSIRDAIAKYAPGSDGNDPAGYAAEVARAAGVDPSASLSSLTTEQRARFLDAQQRKEGWIPGGTAGDGVNASIRGSANHMHGQYGAAGENLTTLKLNSGRTVTVHKEAAESFRGFLNELEGSGYKINSLGGYNYRTIRGGSGLSQHAYGNAIDINPDKNPMKYGAVVTDMPANVGEMAAKYGLSWGGDWKSRKDAMHFEWAGVKLGEKSVGVPAAEAMKAQPQIVVPSLPKLSMSPGGFDVNKLPAGQPMGASSMTTTTNNAGATVTMQPTTTVTINGGDPASNAAQFERAASRVNDRALRNVQTAIR